jgi:D-aminopeptidase
MAEVCTYVPGVERCGDRSTSYQSDDYIQAFKLFTVLRRIAGTVANTSYL